jgi:hypothetical protein
MLPLGDSWNLYGRAGYYWGDNKAAYQFSAQDVNSTGGNLTAYSGKDNV